ncbi:MAG: cupin domain-containing protein [Desulfobacterales bacterium]|nr:cupin domain-containing protein [Desulfobacterales bacterium]
MDVGNLFTNIPSQLPDEIFENIIIHPHCRIERIVSKGHASPSEGWYDQENHEWVLILKGRAKLQFEISGEIVEMRAGDYINIAAHCRHKVIETDPDTETIWLAIHY